MEDALPLVVWTVWIILTVVIVAAQLKLFSIDESLKEIKKLLKERREV